MQFPSRGQVGNHLRHLFVPCSIASQQRLNLLLEAPVRVVRSSKF